MLRTRRLQLRFRDRELEPNLTVSVGVATVGRGGDYSHEHAVQRADLALYATKARGRDGWSAAVEADAVSAAGEALLKTAS